MQSVSQMGETVRSDQRPPNSEAIPTTIGVRRELHVHPHPPGLYKGVAYINGEKVGQTNLVDSFEAAKQAATVQWGEGFVAHLWSQDNAIIFT